LCSDLAAVLVDQRPDPALLRRVGLEEVVLESAGYADAGICEAALKQKLILVKTQHHASVPHVLLDFLPHLRGVAHVLTPLVSPIRRLR